MTVATPDKLARLRALHPDWSFWKVGTWWWASCGTRWARANDLDVLELDLDDPAGQTTCEDARPGDRATGRGCKEGP